MRLHSNLRNMLQFCENSSFEAKNITCDFLHESSFLAIEITKDIFTENKKCKKVQESGKKDFFAFSSPMAKKIMINFHPLCMLS